MRNMADALQEIRLKLSRSLNGYPDIRVLDAGCGRASYAGFLSNAHFTGIDIDSSELEKNNQLDEKIHGDIQSHSFAENSFTVIVLWNVLEHLEHPARTLEKLEPTLQPGGYFIIAGPDLFTLKGLTTRLTPYRLHAWLYRRLSDHSRTGVPEMDHPFPTRLRFDSSLYSIRRFAAIRKLEMLYFIRYESPLQSRIRRHAPALDRLFSSFRQLPALDRFITTSDFAMLLHKKEVSPSHEKATAEAEREHSSFSL